MVGEEAQRKGVIGPMPLVHFIPKCYRRFALASRELSPLRQLGIGCFMRLEQLKPARFDEAMREQMQQDALNAFLEDRVSRVGRRSRQSRAYSLRSEP